MVCALHTLQALVRYIHEHVHINQSISYNFQLAEISREASAVRDQLEQLKVGHPNHYLGAWRESRQWL